MILSSRRIFYGWIIVLALAIVGAFNSLLAGSNFPLFVSPMINDLGMTYATFGWAHTGRLVATAFGSPLIGRVIDRFGSRVSLSIAGTLIGALIISLAFVNESWQLISIFILIGLIGFIPGSNLYTAVPIAKWFVVKRGRAMSLAYIGTPVGIVIVVPLTQWILDNLGWRATWATVGLTGGFITVLVALILIRRKPEDMGLHPDGILYRQRPVACLRKRRRGHTCLDGGSLRRLWYRFGWLFRIPVRASQGPGPMAEPPLLLASLGPGRPRWRRRGAC